MSDAVILCRTQNDSIYVMKRLERCGISSHAVRPPRERTGQSCSWGVGISRQERIQAEYCLRSIPDLRWRWLE